MPDALPTQPTRQVLVTNTTPLIALSAATGSLDVLSFLYSRVVVPLEVQIELRAAGPQAVLPIRWILVKPLLFKLPLTCAFRWYALMRPSAAVWRV